MIGWIETVTKKGRQTTMDMFRRNRFTHLRRTAAWLLAVVLMTSALGGCQKKAGASGENTGGQNGTGQSQTSGQSQLPGQKGTAPEAMGRYGETEVGLPEGVSEQGFIQFTRGENGNMELYTVDRDEATGNVLDVFRYVCQDGDWQQDENWEGSQILKDRGIDLNYVAYGMDGNCYVGGTDKDYSYHLYRLEGNGLAAELLEGEFKPKDGQVYGMVPPKFEVLEDGRIAVYGYSEVTLYDALGKRLFAMAKDFSGSTGDDRGFCEDGEFVTVQEGKIVRYSLQNGKRVADIDYDEIKGSREAVMLFGDGSGGVYAVNETGVSHSNKGGTLWEVLIDGSLNRLGMRSMILQGFLAGENGDFYGVFTSSGEKGIQMFHYEYDPDLAAVPPSALTVYSLEDNSTVRQAASLFQSGHPEVRVEVHTAAEGNGTVTEEMIQGLNTELLNGKGADVLILDGLPARSYIEKGILMDMGDIVEEMEGSGEMLNNLLDGFKEEDGAVYQIPARAAFPLLIGEQEALQAYFSLDTMARYQGEKPLMKIENYENLLRKIAHLRYEELFDGEDGAVEKDTLIRYLETVKTLGDANGAKTVFSDEEGERYFVSNNVRANGIVGSATEYDRGVCSSGIEYMDGYWELCTAAEVRNRHPESKFMTAGKLYLPSVMAGINRSTANEELAKEFIRCLLSYDVQKEDLNDGFPVNKKALQTWIETDRLGYSVGVGYGDYNISAGWPALEVRQEIAGMLEGLTVPVIVDETMMKMIVEGSRDYYDGKVTAGQAADGIMRKISIYLTE